MSQPAAASAVGSPPEFNHLNTQSKAEPLLCYCCMAEAERAPVGITAAKQLHTFPCHAFLQLLCSADTEFLSLSLKHRI